MKINDADIKVGDVVDRFGGQYFLVLKLSNDENYVCEGFYIYNGVKTIAMLSIGWQLMLITDQNVIDYMNKKYLEYQLTEIIEK